jgi:hypothetical protein
LAGEQGGTPAKGYSNEDIFRRCGCHEHAPDVPSFQLVGYRRDKIDEMIILQLITFKIYLGASEDLSIGICAANFYFPSV